MAILNKEFHPLSEEYLINQNIQYRKKLGQYFTPASIREHLLKNIPPGNYQRILDPASGSGEFLLTAKEFYSKAKLYGWEIDPVLVKISRKISKSANIINADSLLKETDHKFDLIIGNPPYYEFTPCNIIRSKYEAVLSGRCNIFSMFIKLGLDNLNENGYLAYVVPPSMNNGAYFKKLRSYILERADIAYLKLLNSPSIFHKAQQQVMVMILKKAKNTQRYVFERNGITIFSPNPTALKRAYKNKSTLFESGFKVQTGSVVWNQSRELLTKSSNNASLLIWAHNIGFQKLIFENTIKPQYVKKLTPMVGPAIVVNRIIGNSNSKYLRAALIKKGQLFLSENHVNIIFPPEFLNGKKVQFKQLKSIVNQLTSLETAQIIRLISGNTQLSKTELWKLIPIEID